MTTSSTTTSSRAASRTLTRSCPGKQCPAPFWTNLDLSGFLEVLLQASECHSLGLNAGAYRISQERMYSSMGINQGVQMWLLAYYYSPIIVMLSIFLNCNLGMKSSTSWSPSPWFPWAGSAILGAVLSLPVWKWPGTTIRPADAIGHRYDIACSGHMVAAGGDGVEEVDSGGGGGDGGTLIVTEGLN